MKNFWDNVYAKKNIDQVSWYTPSLTVSLQLIKNLTFSNKDKIIDIGAGRSFLADDLIKDEFLNLTLFDISEEAINQSKVRLEEFKALGVKYIVGDITNYDFNLKEFDVWHDRVVFHFLTEKKQRDTYINSLKKTLTPKGHAILATFGPNGPNKCSGLDVMNYDQETLSKELGEAFVCLGSKIEIHQTPFKTEQEFLYCWYQRV